MGIRDLVNKHKANLDKARAANKARIDAKMARRLENAKTKTERVKIVNALERERLKADRELFQAKAATARAKKAMLKAKKEAGDVSFFDKVSAGFFGPKKRAKPKRRRKATTTRKPATRKRTTTRKNK